LIFRDLDHTNKQLAEEIAIRKNSERERESLITELQKAIDEIQTLRGILPLCSFCKKIRNDNGKWENVDTYIHKHSEADVSHGVCPDCIKKHYPEFDMPD
jgi:DNA repair exonuclease SbcCD ATPase subunit